MVRNGGSKQEGTWELPPCWPAGIPQECAMQAAGGESSSKVLKLWTLCAALPSSQARSAHGRSRSFLVGSEVCLMGGTPYLVLQNLIKSQQLEKSGCMVGKLAVASLNGQVSPSDFLWNYCLCA